MKKAVFLDRDGIVNRELGHYVQHEEDFTILPEIIPFIENAMSLGYLIVIVTNQAGIAKGLYTKEFVEQCTNRIKLSLAAHNLQIEELYYCPHFPESGECLCRKPGSLLIEKAIARFEIDPSQSIMIGDRERDVLAAEAAGVKGFLLPSNPTLEQLLACLPANE